LNNRKNNGRTANKPFPEEGRICFPDCAVSHIRQKIADIKSVGHEYGLYEVSLLQNARISLTPNETRTQQPGTSNDGDGKVGDGNAHKQKIKTKAKKSPKKKSAAATTAAAATTKKTLPKKRAAAIASASTSTLRKNKKPVQLRRSTRNHTSIIGLDDSTTTLSPSTGNPLSSKKDEGRHRPIKRDSFARSHTSIIGLDDSTTTSSPSTVNPLSSKKDRCPSIDGLDTTSSSSKVTQISPPDPAPKRVVDHPPVEAITFHHDSQRELPSSPPSADPSQHSSFEYGYSYGQASPLASHYDDSNQVASPQATNYEGTRNDSRHHRSRRQESSRYNAYYSRGSM
jgi:hypothetical protein